MIEIRTFEGDGAEAHRVTYSVWSKAFGGKTPIPIWSPEFFDWALLAGRPEANHYLIGAYKGSQLVGTLFAEEFMLRVRGKQIRGSGGSWLSVSEACKGHFVAKRMWDELAKRHLERNAQVMLGWTYRAAAALDGHIFWNRAAVIDTIDEVGHWVRVLDHKSVANWEPERIQSLLASVAGLVQRPPSLAVNTTGIRHYEESDLPACMHLVEAQSRTMDLSIAWSADRLARQLKFKDMPRTLVAERDGKAAGFVNYYLVEMLGRHPLRAALIDLFVAGSLAAGVQARLLAAALARMREEGAAFTLLLRLRNLRAWPLISNGFVPLPPQVTFIGIYPGGNRFLGKIRNYDVPPR
ncbi:MAG: GNAT family N-acetyltransferase [Candidatus Hydrogenedentes bacterium]|nr:GNAT family N-acetyltransferase [Candidatus Hydrogenedentota bacterium]